MNTLLTVAAVLAVATFIETTYLTVMKFRQRTLKVARGSILLDTCSIMDGRIVDVAKTGIITAELIIPRSVIHEMQLLADKADHDKRARARKGLDNVRELQKLDSVSVTIVNDGLAEEGGVDERLLNLARKYDASICTTDYNLNKVAKVIGVTVINVNELSQMLRAKLIPGEHVEIKITAVGNNREQGVGYLEDGTMVVVEDAKNLIGQTVKVEVTRSLQTEAGRMMFAKMVKSNSSNGGGNYHGNSSRSNSGGSSNGKSKRVTSRIKAAPAFHSDQLKQLNNKSDKETKETKVKSASQKPADKEPVKLAAKTHTATRRRQSASSAEEAMVRLANE